MSTDTSSKQCSTRGYKWIHVAVTTILSPIQDTCRRRLLQGIQVGATCIRATCIRCKRGIRRWPISLYRTERNSSLFIKGGNINLHKTENIVITINCVELWWDAMWVWAWLSGPPKPASSVSVTKVTSDSVALAWQQTSYFRSVLIRYRVIDSHVIAMCDESYQKPRSNRITVFGLDELTNYEFYVAFVNSAGCSRTSGPQYASTTRPGTLRHKICVTIVKP